MANLLIPNGSDTSLTAITDYIEPSLTYSLNYPDDGQVKGFVDELEAMKQAIYKIINTERYKYIIYSWNYGIELADLFGKPLPYVYAEIQRRLEEALLADDRISKVYDFEFSNLRGEVLVKFKVDTIFGEIEAQKGVSGIV